MWIKTIYIPNGFEENHKDVKKIIYDMEESISPDCDGICYINGISENETHCRTLLVSRLKRFNEIFHINQFYKHYRCKILFYSFKCMPHQSEQEIEDLYLELIDSLNPKYNIFENALDEIYGTMSHKIYTKNDYVDKYKHLIDKLSDRHDFTKAVISDKSLEVSGVYLLSDKLDKIIYVGETSNLKNRLLSHSYKTSNTKDFIDEVKYFRYLPTEYDLLQKTEYNYINLLKSKYNKVDADHKMLYYQQNYYANKEVEL